MKLWWLWRKARRMKRNRYAKEGGDGNMRDVDSSVVCEIDYCVASARFVRGSHDHEETS